MLVGTGHQVESIRHLTEDTYVLRLTRNKMRFRPGQYLNIGPAHKIDQREYSIYSGENEHYLEFLIREVETGYISKNLRETKVGDQINVDGPFGFFTIEEKQKNKSLLFIATGTGISPFHSFVTSYPNIDYTLLHGIRTHADSYEHDVYDPNRIITCTSREDTGTFHGRVTDYLRKHPIPQDKSEETLCYLCGNCDMIYECYDILKEQGVPSEHLFAEVYF